MQKRKIRIDINIGKSITYNQIERPVGNVCLPNSFYVPGHRRIIEFATFNAMAILLDDYHDFYIKYIDKNTIEHFDVAIYLNTKSNHKIFSYDEAVSFLEYLQHKHFKDYENLRSFDIE